MGYKNQKSENGFTLIEILVVIFASTLVMIAIFYLYSWHSKMYLYQEAVVRTSESGRNAMKDLSNYGSQGYRVLTNKTINGTSYSSGPNALVLQVPAQDNSGAAIDNVWDYVVFYTDGNKLFRLISADPSSSRVSGLKILSDSLGSLTLTYDNNNFDLVRKISVNINTQVIANNQAVQNTLEQNIYLKNY